MAKLQPVGVAALRWTPPFCNGVLRPPRCPSNRVNPNLPVTAASTPAGHDRSRDWTRVERDVRTLKPGLREIRPVFLRPADRTRGHAVVRLLAPKPARALERRVAPLGLTRWSGSKECG
jgi:hypothetical protein